MEKTEFSSLTHVSRTTLSSPKDVVNYLSDSSNWPYLVTGGVSTAAFLYYMVPKFLPEDKYRSASSKKGAGKKSLSPVITMPQQYRIFKPIQLPEKLTIQLPGEERIRISCLCKDGRTSSRWIPDLKEQTLYEIFMTGYRISANRPFLGCRKKLDSSTSSRRSSKKKSQELSQEWDTEYTWLTYEEVREAAQQVGSGLVSLGLSPNDGVKVGIFSPNRPEFDITQLANSMYGFVGVPLYDSQSLECQVHIINQTELHVICVADESKIKKLLQAKEELKFVKTIISFEEVSDATCGSVQAAGWKFLTFKQLKGFGSEILKPISPSRPDDIFVIMYTSGTTGVPKGVVLTHKAFISEVESIARLVRGWEDSTEYLPTPDDILISYLPSAHGFNQVITYLVTAYGGKVGYFRGDVKLLLEDAQALHPTFFPMVPRLMNRLYAGVKGKVKGSKVKEYLMDRAVAAKTKEIRKGLFRRTTLYDRFVFGKVQKMLGGAVRTMVTGAAPVSDEVLEFVKCAMGCPVIEGYGQSECTAACTLTLPGQTSVGNVGVPLPCCEIKLVDVPDMDYYAKDDKGEVCFRGSHCFKEYFKEPELTKETLDEDNWVHSGDIGQWTEEGTLKIIDRKKHIFKLSQGEYVTPEKVEGVYSQCPLVLQIYVHGDSLQSCCVGVCIPEEAMLRALAEEEQVPNAGKLTFSQLCSNLKVVSAVLNRLTEHAVKNKLTGLERIKAVYLHDEPLTPECGLLTPTLKSKRSEMAKYFSKQIAAMYAELEETGSTAPAEKTNSKL